MAFTSAQQDALIRLIENGEQIKDACASVGVSARTVRQFVKDGTAASDGGEKHVFAQRYEVAKIRQAQGGLSEDQLVKMLETVARERMNVKAIELLLNRAWRRSKDLIHEEPEKAPSMADELRKRREAREAEA